MDELHANHKEPFERRADLLAFAAKQPGALTANFLSNVHLQQMGGQITKTKQRTVIVTVSLLLDLTLHVTLIRTLVLLQAKNEH